MNELLWSASAVERIHAAKLVTADHEQALQKAICQNCPEEPWPYGITTSLNPIIATLGASPGNSPASGDGDFFTRPSQPLPKAAIPHPGTEYHDRAGYWDKLRGLAKSMLMNEELSETDAYALFANLNLDSGASGDASRVQVDPHFASWILLNIRDRLRPRFLICLGLGGYLQKNPTVRDLFGEVFPEFQLSKPHHEFQFQSYTVQNLRFREWDVRGPNGNEIKIILWPQHPSRAPFTNLGHWQAACDEFAERHGYLVR
mgnify:CR=1 FL=1